MIQLNISRTNNKLNKNKKPCKGKNKKNDLYLAFTGLNCLCMSQYMFMRLVVPLLDHVYRALDE